MKAQVNWLVLGERNTSFYHASVINRRRMNRITSLKDSVGNCITKENRSEERRVGKECRP